LLESINLCGCQSVTDACLTALRLVNPMLQIIR
jgi:hypothetical protein